MQPHLPRRLGPALSPYLSVPSVRQPVTVLLEELNARRCKKSVIALDMKAGGPLVETGYTAGVVALQHGELFGLALMNAALGGFIEMSQVAECSLEAPIRAPILLHFRTNDELLA